MFQNQAFEDNFYQNSNYDNNNYNNNNNYSYNNNFYSNDNNLNNNNNYINNNNNNNNNNDNNNNNNLSFQWNLEDFEIKTKTVEKIIKPLIIQITSLSKSPSANKDRGKSKSAQYLISSLQNSINSFINESKQIAGENPEIQNEMMTVINDVKNSGEQMRLTSIEFVQNPLDENIKVSMVTRGRLLLSHVARLLIMADLVDVYRLLSNIDSVKNDLDFLSRSQNNQETSHYLDKLNNNVDALNKMAARRQKDLKDEEEGDEMGAARVTLKKSSLMLFSATKTFVRHPELRAARENRDMLIGYMMQTADHMGEVAKGNKDKMAGKNEIGKLAEALDKFESEIILDPKNYKDQTTRPHLEKLLEDIVKQSSSLADLSCTRDERREGVVKECQNLRAALQNLLAEYEYAHENKVSSKYVDNCRDQVYERSRALRKQLRRAIIDHISDCFLDVDMPLLLLFQAASNGDIPSTQAYSQVFIEHSDRLIEVANLACTMSNNSRDIRLVKLVSKQLKQLQPQLVGAANILAAEPSSPEAQQNGEIYKGEWLRGLDLLTGVVDNLMQLNDFLAVSEHHILEEINKCVEALETGNGEALDETSGRIRGRCGRICGVVEKEMEILGHGNQGSLYVDRVMECVKILREQTILDFTKVMNKIIINLQKNQPISEEEFVHVTNSIYDDVKNIRKAVLNNQSIDDYDSEMEENETNEFSRNCLARQSRRQENMNFEENNDQASMRNLSEKDRIKIQQEVQLFRMEKAKLDKEMEKWDEGGNDIIIIAKQMCIIMMEMTDFMRGQGPLKSTMDVINSAKKISEAGNQLDKLCTGIADQCEDSVTKKDLLSYLQRIGFHSHQLNITSKVKADVQNIAGELIVSNIENATSLIVAAKNLMNSVVSAVRFSYVASTKYPKAGSKINISWKMKVPEKKPLIQRENPEESKAKVRKGDNKKQVEPIKVLSEFHS